VLSSNSSRFSSTDSECSRLIPGFLKSPLILFSVGLCFTHLEAASGSGLPSLSRSFLRLLSLARGNLIFDQHSLAVSLRLPEGSKTLSKCQLTSVALLFLIDPFESTNRLTWFVYFFFRREGDALFSFFFFSPLVLITSLKNALVRMASPSNLFECSVSSVEGKEIDPSSHCQFNSLFFLRLSPLSDTFSFTR